MCRCGWKAGKRRTELSLTIQNVGRTVRRSLGKDETVGFVDGKEDQYFVESSDEGILVCFIDAGSMKKQMAGK